MEHKSLILHVGMGKTGSTSIQKSLYKNLKSDDHKYIAINGSNGTGIVKTYFRNNLENIKAAKIYGYSMDEILQSRQEIEAKLISSITSSEQMNMIISAEGFGGLSKEELLEVKCFFEKLGCEIKIVAYVRPPRGFMESAFQQKLKLREANFNMAEFTPNYMDRFEKFDEVFGRENVELWKFDPKSFVEGDVVLDFCSKVGIPINKEFALRTNESLSKTAIALLYVYRKLGHKIGVGKTVIQENNHMLKVLARLEGGKFKFSPNLFLSTLESNKADIKWMEERMGTVFDNDISSKPTDVKSEKDLETIAINSIESLNEMLDKPFTPMQLMQRNGVEKVIDVMHKLYSEVEFKINKDTLGVDMNQKTMEIVEKVKAEIPNVSKKVNDKMIQQIITKSFEIVNNEIVESSEEKIIFQKLGRFTKREIERNGEKTTRIIFSPKKTNSSVD